MKKNYVQLKNYFQNHQIKSYEINKVSLSCYDDKRYILEDGIHSYAYGHYAILDLKEKKRKRKGKEKNRKGKEK